MKLKSILAVATVLACSWNPAQAASVLIDNFNGPSMIARDMVNGGGGVSLNGGPVNPPANTLSRTLSHEWLGAVGQNNDGGANSDASVDVRTAGALHVFNNFGYDSVVNVSWNLGVGFLGSWSSGAASLVLDFMNTPGIAMYSVYYQDQLIRTDAVSGLQSQFYLGEQVQDLIAGSQGQLRLAFTGERGFQVKLNEVRFEVEGTRDLPEPAALALVGMALAGAGWASRRRRLS